MARGSGCFLLLFGQLFLVCPLEVIDKLRGCVSLSTHLLPINTERGPERYSAITTTFRTGDGIAIHLDPSFVVMLTDVAGELF